MFKRTACLHLDLVTLFLHRTESLVTVVDSLIQQQNDLNPSFHQLIITMHIPDVQKLATASLALASATLSELHR